MPLTATPFVCLAFAAIATAPVEASKPAPTVLLRYRFAEGEAMRYEVDQGSTLFAIKGDLRQKTYSRTQTEQRLKVLSVDAGGVATLRLSIDAARMEYAFDDAVPTVLDSREKNLPASVSEAIGRPMAEIRVRPDGYVESVVSLLPDRDRPQTGPGQPDLGSDGANNLFMALPAEPVAVGGEWHETVSTRVSVTERLSQEVKILRQYRLERIEEGVAVIAVKTRVVTPVTEPTILVQLIKRTSSGTVRFDIAAGRIVDRETKVDNTEIGWHGADSSLRAVATWTERLVTEPTTVSAR